MLEPKSHLPKFRRAFDKKTVANEYNFSDEEIKKYKLDRKPSYTTYIDGIFFVQGQNKGALLKILLKKTGFNPRAIVFVDSVSDWRITLKTARSPIPRGA